jgi:hypothetical protein
VAELNRIDCTTPRYTLDKSGFSPRSRLARYGASHRQTLVHGLALACMRCCRLGTSGQASLHYLTLRARERGTEPRFEQTLTHASKGIRGLPRPPPVSPSSSSVRLSLPLDTHLCFSPLPIPLSTPSHYAFPFPFALLARAGALSLHFTCIAPAASCLRLPLRVSQLAVIVALQTR